MCGDKSIQNLFFIFFHDLERACKIVKMKLIGNFTMSWWTVCDIVL